MHNYLCSVSLVLLCISVSDVKFGFFLNIWTSFATIQILFEVQKCLQRCCIVKAAVWTAVWHTMPAITRRPKWQGLSMSVVLSVDDWPRVNGHAGTAAIRMLSSIPVLLCCVVCRAHLDHPLPPPLRVGAERYQPWVGMISSSHACPPMLCRQQSRTSGVHHRWYPATASNNGSAQPQEWTLTTVHMDQSYSTNCRTSQQHHPDLICICCSPRNRDKRWTVAFDRMLLTNEYRRVGKRIGIQKFYSKFEFLNFVSHP